MRSRIQLSSLERLISQCWINAESATAKAVAEKYHSPNEENLTFIFSGELRSIFSEANRHLRIENAFSSDLKKIHSIGASAIDKYRGLTARVNFHNKQHEGRKSAADIGIAIKLPELSIQGSYLKVNGNVAVGLLAQAKLSCLSNSSPSHHHFDELTKPQKRLFAERHDYYSLLLYRLSGRKCDQLHNFGWQLCKDRTLDEIHHWLRYGEFPNELSSKTGIEQLFCGKIGTHDESVVNTIIDPTGPLSQIIELQISWPNDRRPPDRIPLRAQVVESQKLYQRR
jgi:hypothetical protein